MRIRGVAVAFCVAALAACSGSNGTSEQPQAIPAETTVATTTTVAPTTTAPKGLGVTQRHSVTEPGFVGGTSTADITVFRYRDGSILEPDVEADLRREGKRTVAIEVRVCIREVPPETESYVSWQPWSLGDDSGGSYETLSEWSGDITAQPVYPDQKTTPAGTCRRGWVPFEIPANYKPDFVEYNPQEGTPLKWPISG